MTYVRTYKKLAVAALCGATFLVSSASYAASQPKQWVISWFTLAMHSEEGDCPKGLNPSITEFYTHDLAAVGHSKEDIEKILGGMNHGDPYSTSSIVYRGRIDGKPVNAYTNPSAVPSAPQLVSEGRYAYGFNLDGKGAASPLGFEDPETHEKGVNNQYARITGCLMGYRAKPPVRPLWWELTWRNLRDSMPVWLITATIDNEETGEATIIVNKGLEHLKLDANAEAKADMTYRVDPDPQWHNVLKARYKDGTYYVDGGNISVRGDPYLVARLRLSNVHMRLKTNEKGGLDGIIGGYEPWMDINFMYGSRGYPAESNLGVDMPAMYKALRDHADAEPDPKTGKNTAISVGYRVEATPAFIIPAEVAEKKISTR
jgi:hypothetical protein